MAGKPDVGKGARAVTHQIDTRDTTLCCKVTRLRPEISATRLTLETSSETRLRPENSAKTILGPETRPSAKWYTLSRYMYLTILNNCLCISGIERGWGGNSHKIKMWLTELMRKLFVGFIGLLRTRKGPLRHPAHPIL